MTEHEPGTEHHVEVFNATARGSGWPTAVSITGTAWELQVDEPVEDGGGNSGPNPMQTFAASLAGCQNEQAQVVAGEMGLVADHIELTIEIELNLDGFMGATDDSEGCFQRVHLNAVVHGVEAAQAATLGERVDRRCPILSLLRSAGAEIHSTWVAG
jgi:putative redox protein